MTVLLPKVQKVFVLSVAIVSFAAKTAAVCDATTLVTGATGVGTCTSTTETTCLQVMTNGVCMASTCDGTTLSAGTCAARAACSTLATESGSGCLLGFIADASKDAVLCAGYIPDTIDDKEYLGMCRDEDGTGTTCCQPAKNCATTGDTGGAYDCTSDAKDIDKTPASISCSTQTGTVCTAAMCCTGQDKGGCMVAMGVTFAKKAASQALTQVEVNKVYSTCCGTVDSYLDAEEKTVTVVWEKTTMLRFEEDVVSPLVKTGCNPTSAAPSASAPSPASESLENGSIATAVEYGIMIVAASIAMVLF